MCSKLVHVVHVRPSFAASRLPDQPNRSEVEYGTAKGVTCCMDALDWIAWVTSSHIPAHHEQTLRYYGRYSNAARGKRRKKVAVRTVHSTGRDQPWEPDSPAERFSRERRRNWARLLRKIYQVDPLSCAQCGSPMEISSWIDHPDLIRRILQHLNLGERPQRFPPPRLFPRKLDAFLATRSPRQAQQLPASSHSLFWDDVPVWRE